MPCFAGVVLADAVTGFAGVAPMLGMLPDMALLWWGWWGRWLSWWGGTLEWPGRALIVVVSVCKGEGAQWCFLCGVQAALID